MPRALSPARRRPLHGASRRLAAGLEPVSGRRTTATRLGLALLVGALAGLVTTGAPASAHTALRSSSPADGEALAAPPKQIRLVFTETVATTAPPQVAVTLAGQTVPSGPVRVDGATIAAPVTASGPGTYTVAYRVVAADGHPVQGTLRFTVTGGGLPTASPAASGGAPSASATATPRPSVSATAKGLVPPPADKSRWPHVVIAVVILILIGIAIALATGQRPPKRRRF
jgi:methionine-rich copper-binding protein CopC